MIIYKITNTINNKCYIGQTTRTLEKRKYDHLYYGRINERLTYLQYSVYKYGWVHFEWEVLCECQSKDEMDEMEYHYIKQYNSKEDAWGYNMTEGGAGKAGAKLSEETKMKIGHGNLGKVRPEKRIVSAETRQKMSDALKGKICMKNRKEYIFISPTGEVYKVKGLVEFCKEHNLNPSSMSKVARGIMKQTKGWHCQLQQER